MALKKRAIDYTFTLGEGSFGTDGSNTVNLKGMASTCRVENAGGQGMCSASMTVFGVPLSTMNRLSTLGLRPQAWTLNSVLVEAGDEEEGKAIVFMGQFNSAWANLNDQPNANFRVEAFSGGWSAVEPLKPSSYSGPTSVAVIMASLAARMTPPHIFENTGVTTVLESPYFSGSPRNQAYACAEAAGCNITIEKGILAIWPKGQARGGQEILISKDSGLILSPTFTSNGIMFDCVFNPSISFGAAIRMESIIEQANRTWRITKVIHDIAAMVVGGPWKSTIYATPPELFAQVIQR